MTRTTRHMAAVVALVLSACHKEDDSIVASGTERAMEKRDVEQVLLEYVAHRNRHDLEGALVFLASDFEIQFAGGPSLTKQEAASSLGWDIGARGSVEWRVVARDEDVIEIEGTETNDFLQLIDCPPIPFRSRYEFNEAGLISRQFYEADWSEVSVPEALAPAIAWASEHAPAELAEVYPEGRMVYSEETARKWIALLRRWRGSVGR